MSTMDFKHTSIKQSALGWVKKSIDENLATIRSELNYYIEEKDASKLASVQEKLSDLQGVLTMIEQFGAALLTEEMSSLCHFVADKEQMDEQALEVLLRSVLQLPDYLERIQAGQRDIPIAILPLLNDIRAAKNEDLFSEKLLFLPDLSMHMDVSEFDVVDERKSKILQILAKKLRPSYQYSLLGLIRDKDIDSNLLRLEKITEVMEERSSSEQVARLWWLVGALIESISRDNLPLGVSTKMLIGKVDHVFRRLILNGEKELLHQQPIELIKNLLYYIAQPECDGPKSQAIKTAYRLEQFMPSDKDQMSENNISRPNQELLRTVSDAVQADLEEVKSTLEVYVNGDMTDTDQLKDIPAELHVISDTLAMIGLGHQRQLIESQIKTIADIIEGAQQPDEEKLLAMAAELIQVDQALELMQKGQFSQSGAEEATTNTASRNFEMDNMLSGVVTAALDGIQKIKNAILDFIKDPTKQENIIFCQTLLHETRGALELLNEDRAVAITQGLIQYLKDHDTEDFLDSSRLDQLSQVVVSIEYYLEAVGEQRSDAEPILDFADNQLQLLLASQTPGALETQSSQVEQENLLIDVDADVDEVSLVDVNLTNREADTDKQSVEEADAGDSLEFDLVEEQTAEKELQPEPEIQKSVDLSVVETKAEVEKELTSDLTSVTPIESDVEQQVGSPIHEIEVELVHDDMPVLKADADEEILEIYLEEAEEETENIRQLQQDWQLHPEDDNALKNIRRAFHTIKGSGRLVGAMKIGEFAWDFEVLLNRVIDKTVMPSEQVIEVVGKAAEVLPQLVEELKTGAPPTADMAYIRGLARALAEFKANKVLEIRQSRNKEVEHAPVQSEATVGSDEPSEEPGPVREQTESQEIEVTPDEQAAEPVAEQSEATADSDESFEELEPVGEQPESQEIEIKPDEQAAETVAEQSEATADSDESSEELEPVGEQAESQEIEIKPDEQAAEPVAEQSDATADSDESSEELEPLGEQAESQEKEVTLDGQAAEPVAEQTEVTTDSDEPSEEPEPVRELTESQAKELTPEGQAAEKMSDPIPSLDNEPEETPPDPLVSSTMESMPGGEVDPLLPDSLESGEQSGLQFDPILLNIYQQEVESHLNIVNSALDKAQQEGELIPDEEFYRALHTIKGASRMADIESIGLLASLLEQPLKILIEQNVSLDDETMGLYRQGHEALCEMTLELVEQRRIPELSKTLQNDLQDLIQQLENQPVEIIAAEQLPEQEEQPSSQLVETLTLINEEAPALEFDDELVEIFIDEATDLLEMSDHTLQVWSESAADDSPNFGLVMELQRYLHTLKGGARMAEFNEIGDLSHEMESLFIAVIDTHVDTSDDLFDALNDSFDLLNRQVEQAKNHQSMDSSATQIDALKQLRGVQLIQQDVEDHDKETEQSDKNLSVESISEESTRESERHKENQSEPHNRRDNDFPTLDRRKSPDQDVVKVRSDLLDNLVNSAGEVSIYRARMEQQVSSLGSNLGELDQTISRLKNQLRALEAETDAQIHFSHREDTKVPQSFDPLELDRYSQIQELSKSLSESVDDLSSLKGILGDQVKDSETLLLQQSRINTDLQDGLIRSRMVRFASMTSRLRRLVRQTSSELAKKAELVITGDQHELDIKVLDRMVAPLEHILRNAISHGIESPIERVNKGKSETGTIKIEVSRDGSDIVLKISDDGAGVNVDKVRSRALQLGLLGEKEELKENDVIQFILEPGFSTADSVSQVAGRGVGMDVVDSSIKQLGGALQISTSEQGTLFTARLPFTLSINQAILVRAADESYALPLINIEGITRIESDQMMEFYQHEKPALDYAGQHYGLLYLTSLLDANKSFRVDDPTSKVPVILLRSGDLRVAMHIDEIIGNREIVVKPLGKLLSQVKGLSGASILADGLVVLILDINGLIRHGFTTQIIDHSRVEKESEAAQARAQKVVMVVDDSITMRRVATKLLTRNNYEVVTAKDGVDALAQLEDSNPDVMLLDIEMPRMDGFELASHMRNEDKFRDIPIIMITSRTGAKHRDHAKKLGVDKYMGKPYQEEELIDNISALVG